MNADVRPIELHKPLLFIANEEHASSPETQAREYIGSVSNTYYIVVAGADHMSLTWQRTLGLVTLLVRESQAHSAQDPIQTMLSSKQMCIRANLRRGWPDCIFETKFN